LLRYNLGHQCSLVKNLCCGLCECWSQTHSSNEACSISTDQDELPQDMQQRYKTCSMVVILVGVCSASKQSTQQMDTNHHINKACWHQQQAKWTHPKTLKGQTRHICIPIEAIRPIRACRDCSSSSTTTVDNLMSFALGLCFLRPQHLGPSDVVGASTEWRPMKSRPC